MLEKELTKIIGTTSEVRVLRFLLNNSNESFTLAEIVARTKVPAVRCRKYLKKIESIGLVKSKLYAKEKNTKIA